MLTERGARSLVNMVMLPAQFATEQSYQQAKAKFAADAAATEAAKRPSYGGVAEGWPGWASPSPVRVDG